MRILHLINSLALGGAERLLSLLAPLQASAGQEVTVASLSGREDFFGPGLEAAGVRVLRLSEGPIYHPGQPARLRRLLREERPEVLHVHLFPAQYFAAAAARESLRPEVLLTTEHGAGNRRMGRALFRPWDRWAYSRYDARVAVSEETAQALRSWTGLDFGVIRNGIELREALPPRSRGREDPLRIGIVGRLAPPKDPFTVIRALSLLSPRVAASFVGEGELRPAAEALAARLGLGERTRFLGLRADVPALLEGFDLLVHASASEGLALSVLEAMAAGLPCLLSDIPALRETGGEAARYFRNGDPDSLAAEIRRLAEEPAEAAALGAAARKRAEGFDIRGSAESYLGLYAEIRGRKAMCRSSR